VALEQGLRLAKQVAKQPDVTRFVTAGRGAMVGASDGGVLTLLAGPLGLAAGLATGGLVQRGGQAAAETSGGPPV
jgi:hypothetical protein